MYRSRFLRRAPLPALAATLLIATLASGPADARQPGQSAQPLPRGAAPAQPAVVQRAREIQQQLVRIRNETLAARPELAQQRDELRALIAETMRDAGHTPEADMERLREISEQARSPELEDAERRELAQEFRSTRNELVQAQREAMQTEDVQRRQTRFLEALRQAMVEEEPRTEDLMAELDSIEQDLRSRG